MTIFKLILGLAFVCRASFAAFETNPKVLSKREKEGFAFSQALCGKTSCPSHHQLVEILSADISERAARVKKQSNDIYKELFNAKWLESPATELRLIGIGTRWDRMPLIESGCGEVRLIYRLVARYEEEGEAMETYLPLTAMIVHELEANDCRQLARVSSTKELLRASKRKRLEVNLLNLRVPAPALPSTAGYAEYLLRVFHVVDNGDKLAPAKLENTPDVERLRGDKGLRKELAEWLSKPERKTAIESGHLKVPDHFLATVAISVAPFAGLRLTNAPYSALYEGEFSPAVLQRLNRLSCQGCHQTNSDAGFHFHGESLEKSFAFNRTRLFASPHFFAEQKWREKFRERFLSTGKWLDRPLPGRTFGSPGVPGDLCSTSAPVTECAKGVSCRRIWDVPEHPELEVGYCQKAKSPIHGEPCFLGTWQEPNPVLSSLGKLSSTECFSAARCLPHEIGFPGGICTTDCERLVPGASCHSIPALDQFTSCVQAGGTMKKCFDTASVRAGLRKCGFDSPCRPDYVCASKGKRGRSRDEGVCVPPYFLPQLNLTNHRF